MSFIGKLFSKKSNGIEQKNMATAPTVAPVTAPPKESKKAMLSEGLFNDLSGKPTVVDYLSQKPADYGTHDAEINAFLKENAIGINLSGLLNEKDLVLPPGVEKIDAAGFKEWAAVLDGALNEDIAEAAKRAPIERMLDVYSNLVLEGYRQFRRDDLEGAVDKRKNELYRQYAQKKYGDKPHFVDQQLLISADKKAHEEMKINSKRKYGALSYHLIEPIVGWLVNNSGLNPSDEDVLAAIELFYLNEADREEGRWNEIIMEADPDQRMASLKKMQGAGSNENEVSTVKRQYVLDSWKKYVDELKHEFAKKPERYTTGDIQAAESLLNKYSALLQKEYGITDEASISGGLRAIFGSNRVARREDNRISYGSLGFAVVGMLESIMGQEEMQGRKDNLYWQSQGTNAFSPRYWEMLEKKIMAENKPTDKIAAKVYASSPTELTRLLG